MIDDNQKEKKKELIEFKKKHGMRDSWHEPDEQGITARVTGIHFDNAMGESTQGEELVVVLYRNCGVHGPYEEMRINLATLLAIASEEK